MGVWIVTWDGPRAGERSSSSWHSRANAEIVARRKINAGLNPVIYNSDDLDIEEALAARKLEDQP